MVKSPNLKLFEVDVVPPESDLEAAQQGATKLAGFLLRLGGGRLRYIDKDPEAHADNIRIEIVTYDAAKSPSPVAPMAMLAGTQLARLSHEGDTLQLTYERAASSGRAATYIGATFQRHIVEGGNMWVPVSTWTADPVGRPELSHENANPGELEELEGSTYKILQHPLAQAGLQFNKGYRDMDALYGVTNRGQAMAVEASPAFMPA